jgi:protein-S-isoprenylcysteine O-methyltransferase Ste14
MENNLLKHPAIMLKIGNYIFTYRNKLFPLIYLVAFIMFAPEPSRGYIVLGFLVAGLGQLTRAMVIGYAYIKRGGVNKKVYAENLVTTGFFGICRNPLYVGNVLMVIGLLLIHGNEAVILLGTALFIFIYYCIIFAEEAYLQNKFGDAYVEYCRDVPRWIPKFEQLKESTVGMEFNTKRVILKDYSTFTSWSIFALLLLIYENYHAGFPVTSGQNMNYFMGLVIVISFAFAVRYLKKTGKLVE